VGAWARAEVAIRPLTACSQAATLELARDGDPEDRVDFKMRGRRSIALLAGGDKSTQARDVRVALRLARDLEE